MNSLHFSLIVPIYRPKKIHLEQCIDSILQQDFSSEGYEIIFIQDFDGENHAEMLNEATKGHSKVKVIESKKHLGISNATNLGVSHARGEYVVLIDQDDLISFDALKTLHESIYKEKVLPKVIHSDYCLIEANGDFITDVSTPDFSPERMSGLMYAAHLKVIERKFWNHLGGYSKDFDGAQDHEFFLRAFQKTYPLHIPRVLYSWRASETSSQSNQKAKPHAPIRTKLAIERHLFSLGLEFLIKKVNAHPVLYRTDIISREKRGLSIIIPTRFEKVRGEIALVHLLKSIERSSGNELMEIVCVINSREDATKSISQISTSLNLKWVECKQTQFNFSKAVNFGVENSSYENILILNDDTEFIKFDWLYTLNGYLENKRVGVVGAKLLYPSGEVQHAGIGITQEGHCYHILHKTINKIGSLGEGLINHEVDAVTGAFMGLTRKTWVKLGGLPVQFPGNYNDVALCLKAWNSEMSVVQVNSIELIHHESLSRIPERTDKEISDFLQFLKNNPKKGTFTLTPEFDPPLRSDHQLKNPAGKDLLEKAKRWISRFIKSVRYRGILGAIKNFMGV
jgi:glycosyltransferase involved in cell wall biosynthesis